MSAPTPVAETYVACENSVFNIGGTFTAASLPATPASVTGGTNLAVTKGGYKVTYGVKEMTNSGSGGAYEDVKTIKKVTGSFTCAYKAGTPPTFAAGELYLVNIFNPNTSASFQGTVRLNNVDEPILDVDSGLMYSFDITSQGSYTVTQ